MKRDFDLIKLILQEIENAKTFDKEIYIQIDGYNTNEINYHLKMLIDANFIEGSDRVSSFGHNVDIRCLTWRGHEFLDNARDNKIWKKAKSIISKKSGSISLEIFEKLLVKLGEGFILGDNSPQ